MKEFKLLTNHVQVGPPPKHKWTSSWKLKSHKNILNFLFPITSILGFDDQGLYLVLLLRLYH